MQSITNCDIILYTAGIKFLEVVKSGTGCRFTGWGKKTSYILKSYYGNDVAVSHIAKVNLCN